MRWLRVCRIIGRIIGVTAAVRGTISKLQSEEFDAGNFQLSFQLWDIDLECRRGGNVSVRGWPGKTTPKSDGQAPTRGQDDGNDCRSR